MKYEKKSGKLIKYAIKIKRHNFINKSVDIYKIKLYNTREDTLNH